MLQDNKYLQLTVGGIAFIIAIPLIAILFISFYPEELLWEHYLSTVFPSYLLNTLIYTFGSSIVATILGTTSAWIVSSTNIPGRNILNWVLLFPFAIPAYVVAFVYAELFEYSGLIQTLYRWILIINLMQSIPFLIFAIWEELYLLVQL